MRRRQINQFTTTVLAQGIILALGIASGILSARMLGPTGRGVMAAVIIWPSALVFLASCGINQAIVYQASKSKYTCSQTVSAVLAIAIPQSIIVIGVGLFILPIVLRRYSPEVLHLALWFLAFTPALLLGGYPANILQALRHIGSFNLVRTLAPAVYVLGLLFLSLTHRSCLHGIVTAQVVGYLAALGAGLALLLRKVYIRPIACGDAARDLLGYGARAQLTNLTAYFNQRCDQLVLSVLVSPDQLGLYAVGVTLATAVSFVPQAAGLVAFADGASQGPEAAHRIIGTSFRLSAIWLATTCTILFLVAPTLVVFVFGPKFAGASVACRVLLPGMVALGLNQVLYAGANALGHPALPSLAELVSLVLTAAGLLVLVPTYGYVGAALISTIAYLTSLIVILRLYTTRLGFTLPELIFPNKTPSTVAESLI